MKKITVGIILLVSFLLGVIAPINYTTTSSSGESIFGLGVHKAEAKKTKKKKKKRKTKKKAKKKTKKKKKNKLTKNEKKLANFSKNLVSTNDDDRTKITKIYNWITANISYDKEKAKKIASGKSYAGENTPYETYKNRKGVCAEYSELLFTMLEDVGINSDTVTGPTYIGNGSDWGEHEWNEVKINGETLYMDSTYDAGRDPSDYMYFLIPEKCISVTHSLNYNTPEYSREEQTDYVKNNLDYFNEHCPRLERAYYVAD